MTSTQWLVSAVKERVHTTPIDDLIEHDRTSLDECVCGPTVQFGDEHGTFEVPLVNHHSLDGRENSE